MTDERPKVIVLVGPTAVGKTETVLHLAAALPVEIVNADSMQVSRYMDIETAKPSATERALVPHHLLDLVEPDEDFDAYRYRDLGRDAVAEVWRNRRTALVVGGTGLYVKPLLHGLFPGAPRSAEIRARLRSEGEAMGAIHLFHRLAAVDSTTAERIHCSDLVRIIRALEVWKCSGRPISAWQREHGFREHPFRVFDTESDIGWTLGANVGLGMFGLHVAYDSQDFRGTTQGVLGLGAHIWFGVPGM